MQGSGDEGVLDEAGEEGGLADLLVAADAYSDLEGVSVWWRYESAGDRRDIPVAILPLSRPAQAALLLFAVAEGDVPRRQITYSNVTDMSLHDHRQHVAN